MERRRDNSKGERKDRPKLWGALVPNYAFLSAMPNTPEDQYLGLLLLFLILGLGLRIEESLLHPAEFHLPAAAPTAQISSRDARSRRSAPSGVQESSKANAARSKPDRLR